VCIEKISFDLNLILRNIRTLGTIIDNWEKNQSLGKRKKKQKDVEFKEMRGKKER
jgi:hypothetical protein